MKKQAKFSDHLSILLTQHKKIKLIDLNGIFGEKSFAIAFILLMIIAALPLPTGGVTHIFEIITILLSIELILGRDRIWLPKKLENHEIHSLKKNKTKQKLVSFIKFLEIFSRPRGHFIANHHIFVRFIGFAVMILALSAFFAPPFSGLDTLPALGIVVLSLGLVFDDIIITILGLFIGFSGLIIILSLLDLITSTISHIVRM
jgi:hypothetical protein